MHAAALQHGSLMRSTSPMMEALPRLHQISKTDIPHPLHSSTPLGGEARRHCCPLMQSNVCFLDSALHRRPCQRTLCRPPWRNSVVRVNIDLSGANLKAQNPEMVKCICKGKGRCVDWVQVNHVNALKTDLVLLGFTGPFHLVCS